MEQGYAFLFLQVAFGYGVYSRKPNSDIAGGDGEAEGLGRTSGCHFEREKGDGSVGWFRSPSSLEITRVSWFLASVLLSLPL